MVVDSFLTTPARAEPPADAVSFERDVAPIVANRCVACHGPEKAKGRYRVDTFAMLQKAGTSEERPVTAGKPDASELYRLLVTHDEDERMPQKADRLPDAEIQTIRRWIEQGAAFDGPDPATPMASYAGGGTVHPPAPAVYPRPVPVTALAFSPDGTQLAASGYHEVTIWDVPSGKLRQRLDNVAQRTLALSWSPDGKTIAVAGGNPGTLGEVRLLDPAGVAPARVIDRLGDLILAARFSPDGSRLAAAGSDNAIRIYEVPSGKPLHRIEQHADWVTDVAFSPDGRRLACASRDKTCRVFDVATGSMVSAYVEQHAEPVLAVAWAADDKAVFSAGRDRKLHAWNPADGKTAYDEKKGPKAPKLPSDVLRLQAVPGAVLLATADGKVRQHADAGAREQARVLDAFKDWPQSLAVHEKAGLVAAGSHGGEVRVWRLKDGEAVATFTAMPGRGEGAAE